MRDSLTRFLSALTLHVLITAPAAGWAMRGEFESLMSERNRAMLTFADFIFAAGWVLLVGYGVGWFVALVVHQLHHWLDIDLCTDRAPGNDDEGDGPLRPREA